VKLRLVVVGKDRGDPICDAAGVYLERIQRYYPITLVEVKEEPERSSTPVDRILAQEAERIKKALGGDDFVVGLDRLGKVLSSEEIAQKLSRWAIEVSGTVSFIIGGPRGISRELSSSCRELWSFGKLTLPHRIARLVLAEQLYRACTIMRGEPYHK
jgi:23S rRNA (pseudouridine1915-N3)-methyltransferase